MLKVQSIIKNQAGFSAVEALLAVVVFGLLASGIIGALVYGRAATADAGDNQRASLLAEEGLEGARNLANSSFVNVPSVNGNYGFVQSGGIWTFSGTSDTNGIFTRSIAVTNATNRKTLASGVTWGTNSVSLTSLLSNWEANLKLWTNAIVAGSVDATGTTNGFKVAVSGNFAYVVRNAAASNFVVINISNPAAPSIAATSTFANTPTNIAISGNYAYVTTGTNTTSLEVIDIATPTAPVLRASVTMTGAVAARGVYVYGNYAYVVRASSTTTGANEFTVVDISNPLVPVVVGGYNNNIQMNEVYVSGNFAFVATNSTTQEMLVINITSPTAPTLAATYNPTTPNLAATTVWGYGKTVLLGMGTTLDAINVTTPTAPARLGTFTAAGTITDINVDITNQFAFLGTASTTGEVQVVNIAAPAAMTLTRTVDVAGTTSTVNGVGYANTLDVLVGASAADTLEGVVVTRN